MITRAHDLARRAPRRGGALDTWRGGVGAVADGTSWVAALAVLAVAVLVRLVPVRGRTPIGDAGPVELAAIGAGWRAAVLAALAEMRERGEVVAPHGGGVRRADGTVSGGPGAGAHPLEHALWAELRIRTTPAELASRSRVTRELAALDRRLSAAGLVLPRPRWLLARGLAAVAVGLALYGLLSELSLGALVGTAVVILAAAVLWLWPRRTRAGARLLREARAAGAGIAWGTGFWGTRGDEGGWGGAPPTTWSDGGTSGIP